jgi:hypothetical protein
MTNVTVFLVGGASLRTRGQRFAELRSAQSESIPIDNPPWICGGLPTWINPEADGGGGVENLSLFPSSALFQGGVESVN